MRSCAVPKSRRAQILEAQLLVRDPPAQIPKIAYCAHAHLGGHDSIFLPIEKKTVIVDAHEDLAYNALSIGRNLLKPALESRKRLGHNGPDENGGATTSFPDLISGNIKIVFATLWVNPCNPRGPQSLSKPCYSTQEEAHAQAKAQLEYYLNLEREGIVSIIRSKSDLERTIHGESNRIGIVLLMEGADPISSPAEARDWFREGLRIIGPAWGATKYSGGTKAPGPLTLAGRELLKEMERLGFILDCSHLSEESFFEAIELFKGQAIASHSNSRVFCPTDRHLSDEMILALTSRGGVIGTVLYNAFLEGSWKKGMPKENIMLSHVVRNILHVEEVSKSREHSGIGSDFDGGFGYESIPLEFDTVSDLYKIGDALTDVGGYSSDESAGVLGENFIRVLKRSLPAAD